MKRGRLHVRRDEYEQYEQDKLLYDGLSTAGKEYLEEYTRGTREGVVAAWRRVPPKDHRAIDKLLGSERPGYEYEESMAYSELGVPEYDYRGMPMRDPGTKRHPRRAVRIPPKRRAAVSRKIKRLVAEGYSPRYAARKAYHPKRDLPSWRGASSVYSYLYRVLEKMGQEQWDAAVAEAKRRGRRTPKMVPTAEMEEIIRALDRGDEEELKAIQMRYKLGRRRSARDCVGIHTHADLGPVAAVMAEQMSEEIAERDPRRSRPRVRGSRLAARGSRLKAHEKLTAAQRHALHPSQFALPARRALPLSDSPRKRYDHKYVANASARLAQMHRRGTVTEREYQAAERRIQKAEHALGMGRWHERKHRSARDPRRVSRQDRTEFLAFVNNATDRQLLNIIAKERAANRRVYAKIAEEEAWRRGLR